MSVFLNESFLILLGVNIIAAIGMNLVYVSGQLNLGQAGFLAVGAYAASIVDVALGWPLVPSLAVAAAAAALVALPVAVGAARVHGIYLIMGTLAVGEVVRVTLGNIESVGGLQGYSGMQPVGVFGVYVTAATVLALSVGLMTTHTGLQMRSLFDDEDAAAAAGVPTKRIRILAVVFSAAVVGIAGGLLAKFFLFIAPRNFGLDVSFRIALFTLVGGVHSLLGAIAGALGITGLLEGLKEITAFPFGDVLAPLSRWRLAVYGVLVIALMAVLPEGLVSRRLALRLTQPFRQLRRRSTRGPSDGQGTNKVDRGTAVLTAENVSHRFGGVQALQEISVQITAGEVVALIGANGAGKTTFVNVIAGRYPLQEGRITLLGNDVGGQPAHVRATEGISRTFQDVRVFAHLTVEETLRLGHAAGADRSRSTVDGLLDVLDLTYVRDSLPGSLTLAQRRHLEIGRALAAAPHVMFLDEPSAGMNEQEREELAELIDTIRRGGTAIVLVDHNLDLAFAAADRVVLLDFGEVIARGSPEQIINDPRFREAYLGADQDRDTDADRDTEVQP